MMQRKTFMKIRCKCILGIDKNVTVGIGLSYIYYINLYYRYVLPIILLQIYILKGLTIKNQTNFIVKK